MVLDGETEKAVALQERSEKPKEQLLSMKCVRNVSNSQPRPSDDCLTAGS